MSRSLRYARFHRNSTFRAVAWDLKTCLSSFAVGFQSCWCFSVNARCYRISTFLRASPCGRMWRGVLRTWSCGVVAGSFRLAFRAHYIVHVLRSHLWWAEWCGCWGCRGLYAAGKSRLATTYPLTIAVICRDPMI